MDLPPGDPRDIIDMRGLTGGRRTTKGATGPGKGDSAQIPGLDYGGVRYQAPAPRRRPEGASGRRARGLPHPKGAGGTLMTSFEDYKRRLAGKDALTRGSVVDAMLAAISARMSGR